MIAYTGVTYILCRCAHSQYHMHSSKTYHFVGMYLGSF